MLVFFIVLSIIGLMLLVLFNMQIAIGIEDLKIETKKKEKGSIYLYIYVFKKEIIKIKLGNNTMKKVFEKEKVDFKEMKKEVALKEIRQVLSYNMKIKKIDLEIGIGTGDILLTTSAVAIISTILSCILPLHIEGKLDDNYFKVIPIYDENIKYSIKLNCIIAIKTVHIIHIIYLFLKKRRGEGYGRTSNRKSYEGSYE